MKKHYPNNNDQPAHAIYNFIDGYNYSIRNKQIDLNNGPYTEPYKSGRLKGHKQIKMLILLGGK